MTLLLVPHESTQTTATLWVGAIDEPAGDLVRQATTFRILEGADPVARVVAVLGFARYFAGSLWDTYVRG